MVARNRLMHSMSHRASSMARDTYGQVMHATGDYLEHGRESVHQLADTMQDSMREHPIRWILIGIGLGCLVSAALIDS